MKYYLKVFLTYSGLGFIMENIAKWLTKGKSEKFLYGPYNPIYGVGACTIIAIMRFVFNRFNTTRTVKIISLFLLSTIILTTLEYLTGNLLELLTGKICWDYSDMRFNFGHYISLEIAAIWGILSLVLIYILKPRLDKLLKKIPNSLTYLVLSIFIIDLSICTISKVTLF